MNFNDKTWRSLLAGLNKYLENQRTQTKGRKTDWSWIGT